jgi:hypothetical protein
MPEGRFLEIENKMSLAAAEASCRYISSVNKTDRNNLNDPMGLHYTAKHGQAWGEKVMVELAPLVGGALSNNSGDKSHRPANHLNVK